MTAKNKKALSLLIFVLIILTLTYIKNESEISLSRNRVLTIGKVTQLTNCAKSTKKCIAYRYFINGKWVNGIDRGGVFWPKFIREGKPQVGKYYPVEYDKTNIEYSKIMITEEPLIDKQVEKFLKKKALQNSIKN